MGWSRVWHLQPCGFIANPPVKALIVKIDIVSALMQLLFGVAIIGWVVLLARAAHLPFWAAAVAGVPLGWGSAMLVLWLVGRRKKR